MRTILFVVPAVAALMLAAGCGSGCGHGNHSHPTGSSWERAPDYEATCTCGESGEIECDDGQSAALTSGGVAYN